jgi:molybdopterin-guanine dinucleotide biosynthesis protein A
MGTRVHGVSTTWAAVLLAGGRGSRLGGVDKAALEVGGCTLLDHALTAVHGASPVVVVGPPRPVRGEVEWTCEDPPGGGPAAALAAGLALLPPDRDLVAVLAVDQPGITARTVTRLRHAVNDTGALLVDPDGRLQWLAGVWRVEALRAVMPERPAGASLRSVLGPLGGAAVTALPGEAVDVDTPQDLSRVRAADPSHASHREDG